MLYDDANIFARILRQDIPAKVIYENEVALSFYDVAPQAPVHALVIPKGPFVCVSHFLTQAASEEIVGFWHAVSETVKKLNLAPDGFRLISNEGTHGGQEVPHFHVHILGGAPLGPMLHTSS